MDGQVKKVLDNKEIICRNLVATDILPLLMAVDTIKTNEVCFLIYETQANNSHEAASILVGNLVKSETPGWYQIFLKALVEKGFEIISKTLEHEMKDVRQQNILLELLHTYYPELCDKIDPVQLLPHLIQRGCFRKEDAERVMAANLRKGPSYATLCLLMQVSTKSEDWFQGLMYALSHSGHQDLVDMIEPKLRRAAEESYSQIGPVVDKLCALNVGTEEDPTSSDEHMKGHTSTGRDPGYTVTSTNVPCLGKRSYHASRSTSAVSAQHNKGWDYTENVTHCENHPELSLHLNEKNQPPKDLSMDKPSLSTGFTDSLRDLSSECKISNIPEESVEKEVQLHYKSDPAVELEGPNLCHTAASLSHQDHMVLRAYQQELIQPAMQGKNSIIYAPSGAGKTFTAVALAKHILLKSASNKVIHLVAAADQTQETLSLYEDYVQDHECKAMSPDLQTFHRDLKNTPVFVSTLEQLTQILKEGFSRKDNNVDIVGAFSLMILNLKQPLMYQLREVMAYYYRGKQNHRPVPQILGLLDTLDLPVASNADIAKENILRLCAQFDSRICQVEKHKSDLRKHAVTDQEFYNIKGRDEDPFCTLATKLMIQLESMIKNKTDGGEEVAGIEKKLKNIPHHQGCQEYRKWLKTLQKPVAVIPTQAKRRVYEAYLFNLRTYNEALMINEDCQTSDAIQFIEEKLDEFCKYDTDRKLQELFKENKPEMQEIARTARFENPKLKHLKEIIHDYYYREQKQLRAVLFCKSMNIAECLKKWLGNDSRLDGLRVKNVEFAEGGKEENHILRHLRAGKAGLIITDGKYEDNIKGMRNCNCVIHYMLDKDVAKKRQEGTIKVKGAGGNRDSTSDEYIKGLQQVAKLSETELSHYMDRFPKEARPTERSLDTANSVKFYCSGEDCTELAFYSSQIKKRCGVEVVESEDFRQKVETEQQSPKAMKNCNMQKEGVLNCKMCKRKWGILMKDKENPVSFYVPTVSSFVLEYPDGRKQQYKRWSDVNEIDSTE